MLDWEYDDESDRDARNGGMTREGGEAEVIMTILIIQTEKAGNSTLPIPRLGSF